MLKECSGKHNNKEPSDQLGSLICAALVFIII